MINKSNNGLKSAKYNFKYIYVIQYIFTQPHDVK